MSRLRQVREQAGPIFKRYHPEHGAALPLILKPVINLEAQEVPDASLPVGGSKLGGLPDLGTQPWPEDAGDPMLFVAQFNLTELRPFDEDALFPLSGLLSFFLGRRAIENGRMEPEHWAVRYEPALEALRRASPPPETDGEWATPAHAVAFCAGMHPWGDVGIGQADGIRLSLHYEQVIFDPEWQAVTGEGDLTGEAYLLGDTVATMLESAAEEEGETALLTLPHTSGVFPFVDQGNRLSFAFLIPRADLTGADFRRVRLTYHMS
ncbi:hypothetical protein Dcar01_03212 [Deinococcus carri]|uniref:DUF1963 domain-containing protein n=1 Tax=Deinococcus carri TaxID=1211323 RepID=A0ABP9WAT1_9DEIO